LKEKGYSISDTVVAVLLKEQGYSLQGNRKEPATKENRPGRDEQFEYINKQVKAYMKRGEAGGTVYRREKEMKNNPNHIGKYLFCCFHFMPPPL
jgi:hypothetical protein